jgi:hypothetical protein
MNVIAYKERETDFYNAKVLHIFAPDFRNKLSYI